MSAASPKHTSRPPKRLCAANNDAHTLIRVTRNLLPFHRPWFLRGPAVASPLIARAVSTPRLLLRPYAMTDADDWFRIQSSQEILEYLPWPKRSSRESRVHLRHRTKHTRLQYHDDFLALAVVRGEQVIGDVSMHLRLVGPAGHHGVEVGWLILPGFTRKGYAFEAATAMLRLAFDELKAQWASAQIHIENTSSLRLAHYLGFAQAGRVVNGQCRFLRGPVSIVEAVTHGSQEPS